MAQPDGSILDRVMQLPFEQRVELAARLLESIHPQGEDVEEDVLHNAWIEELRFRVAESESGVPGVPVELVWDKLDARKRAAPSH
jgi:hypothetical protein